MPGVIEQSALRGTWNGNRDSLRVAVALLGARCHYAVPRILHQLGTLSRLFTDICSTKGWPRLTTHLSGALLPPVLARLAARRVEGIPRSRVTAFSRFGWEYARRRAAARTPEAAAATHLWAGETFCRHILRDGLGDATAVYAFNSAALELLHVAREAGRTTILEQTIAPRRYQEETLRSEREQWPDWTTPSLSGPHVARFCEREEAEWGHADLILCGSQFVADTIARCGGPAERCRVVPYGVDCRFSMDREVRRTGPLRVLTVGEVGLRKGSPYVWSAARALGRDARFRMVGPVDVTDTALSRWGGSVELTGPVSRAAMREHFAWADVFLLPSLCEGSAVSVYEALSAGLPVVCTPSTGSVVVDGVDGYIVPTRDVGAIVDRLQRLHRDRDLMAAMSQSAASRLSSYSFASYARRLCEALSSAADHNSPVQSAPAA